MSTTQQSLFSEILKENLKEIESQETSLHKYASSKDKLFIQSVYELYKSARKEVFKYFEGLLSKENSIKAKAEEMLKMGNKAPTGFGMHLCAINGIPVILAGMSHPITYNPDLTFEGVIDSLTSVGFNTLVSFTESNKELKEALQKKDKNWNYFEIPLKDFGDISLKQFDQFYSLMKKQTEKGNQVVVHCRAGRGRTGTMLASLSLRDILNKGKKNDSKEKLLIPVPDESTIVEVTPAVYEAIARTRAFSEHRVETRNNIRDLMLLEKAL